jgi:tetratricopeptide (TPR) repeat protein
LARSIIHAGKRKKETDPLRSAWHILEEWVEINRRQILMICGVAVGVGLLFALAYYFMDYRREVRLAAFAVAYDKFTAEVVEGAAPETTVPGKVTYPDEATKYADAAAAFEALAEDYSAYAELGRYYAALCYLHTDAEKGAKMLADLGNGSSDVARQAQLAHGEYALKTGDYAAAEAAFQKLADDPGPVPRLFVLNSLAVAKERLAKPAEAAALYKEVVSVDRDSQVGTAAEKGLQRVDPAAAAALPAKSAAGPGGGLAHTQSSSPGLPGGTK